MRQTENINWLKVAVYSTTLYISIVFFVAALTYALLKFGYDFTDDAETFWLAGNLTSFVISYVVYFKLAKGQHSRPFEHAFSVYVITLVINFLLDLLIPVNLINWLVFFVEQFVYIGILVAATQHGIKYQRVY